MLHSANRGSVGKGAFESATISATAFDAQLRSNFKVKLTPEELGAVLCKFDMKNTGEIDCGEFLIEFMRLGVFAGSMIHMNSGCINLSCATLGRVERARQVKQRFEQREREKSDKERWINSTTARFTKNSQVLSATYFYVHARNIFCVSVCPGNARPAPQDRPGKRAEQA